MSKTPAAVVRLAGEIDSAVREQVFEEIDAAAKAAAEVGGVLAIDLAEVTFMDSSGLGCIAEAITTVGADGRIVLQNAPRSIQRVLELADLDHLCAGATS